VFVGVVVNLGLNWRNNRSGVDFTFKSIAGLNHTRALAVIQIREDGLLAIPALTAGVDHAVEFL